MAQNPGYLNTSPSPIPGVGYNPTGGLNVGLPNTGISTVLPPSFGGNPVHQVNPIFPANTGGVPSTGSAAPAGMSALSSGFDISKLDPAHQHDLKAEFVRAYGRGTGEMIFGLLTQGMFNPQIANSLIAAMQPGRERGANSVLSAFGNEGARFSSAGAIGLGDFESQATLNEDQVMAGLFQQAQQEQLGLLSETLPTLHTENANANRGWFEKLLGYGEIASGMFSNLMGGSGGSSITAGNNALFGNETVPASSSGSSSGGGSGGLSQLISLFKNNKPSVNNGTQDPSYYSMGANDLMGTTPGGFDPFGGSVDPYNDTANA